MLVLWKFSQNPSQSESELFTGDTSEPQSFTRLSIIHPSINKLQKNLNFTVLIVWWSWNKVSKIYSFFFYEIIHMIQYVMFGQTPSFGSRDRVQTSFFGQNLTFKVLVWPWPKSPKSNNFFPMSQWCFYVSLVKIHHLVQEIECRQDSFLHSLYCGDLEN